CLPLFPYPGVARFLSSMRAKPSRAQGDCHRRICFSSLLQLVGSLVSQNSFRAARREGHASQTAAACRHCLRGRIIHFHRSERSRVRKWPPIPGERVHLMLSLSMEGGKWTRFSAVELERKAARRTATACAASWPRNALTGSGGPECVFGGDAGGG